MIQVLLVVQDQNSNDLIKALCCYKGCKVLVADNSYNLINFLQKEKIDIVFFELSRLNSLALDMMFEINGFDHERLVILISENISESEEAEILKRRIFYRVVKPLNSDEIKQVIDVAINAVWAKMPEEEYHTEERMLADESMTKEQSEKYRQEISRNIFRHVSEIFLSADRRIVSSIKSIELGNLENAVSFIAIPIKSFDNFMMNLGNRII